MKRKPSPSEDNAAERVAVLVLEWLAGEDDRVLSFLQATGLAPDDLRLAAGDRGFLAAVLDHVMGDETAVIECARSIGLPPERIVAAWQRLRPPEFDHTL